jgi:hypothetical protein
MHVTKVFVATPSSKHGAQRKIRATTPVLSLFQIWSSFQQTSFLLIVPISQVGCRTETAQVCKFATAIKNKSDCDFVGSTIKHFGHFYQQ